MHHLQPTEDLAEIVESLCPLPTVERSTCDYLFGDFYVSERHNGADFMPTEVCIGMMESGMMIEDLPHEIRFRKGEVDVRAKMVELEWAEGWQAWYQFEGVVRV